MGIWTRILRLMYLLSIPPLHSGLLRDHWRKSATAGKWWWWYVNITNHHSTLVAVSGHGVVTHSIFEMLWLNFNFESCSFLVSMHKVVIKSKQCFGLYSTFKVSFSVSRHKVFFSVLAINRFNFNPESYSFGTWCGNSVLAMLLQSLLLTSNNVNRWQLFLF